MNGLLPFIILIFSLLPGDDPVISREQGGELHASLPASVLANDEVTSQLKSGLTTTFRILTVHKDGHGQTWRGGARIEVRYELWDEVYLVRTLDMKGERQAHSFASFQELNEWWKRAGLVVQVVQGSPPSQLKFTVEVIPFSATEQSNAQQWFADSAPNAVVGPAGASVRPAPSRGVFEMILATSIRRKPLLKFSWRLPIQ